MNERIRELFDQTLEQFNEEHKDAPYRAMFIVPDPVKEKFAELMIKECIQVLETNNANLTLDSKWEAIYEIETHFGVKK